MGLPRPQEPFERVYSAPEPPAPARRPRVRALLVALVAFAVAAGVVFWLAPGGEPQRAAPARTPTGAETGAGPSASPAEPAPSPSATAKPSASPTPAARLITGLPAPCGMVAQSTVRRLTPAARRSESANEISTTCTYTATSGDFRWLRVETRLYAPEQHPVPMEGARRAYSADWAQASSGDALAETVSLDRQSGLGEEAFRWFKIDKGQPTGVGEITMRVRNAVISVSYSERAAGKGDAAERERSCLAKATEVAREVLGGFR